MHIAWYDNQCSGFPSGGVAWFDSMKRYVNPQDRTRKKKKSEDYDFAYDYDFA